MVATGRAFLRAGACLRQRVVRPALCSSFLRRVLRALARRRGFAEDGVVTVVIVNWESLEYLAVAVHALRRFSPASLQIIVVDNFSGDGSREWLRARSDIREILLPVNVHHGPAMDIGFLVARTQYVLSLDVDAFPISRTWLDSMLKPLSHGAEVSGVASQRAPYVHPCMLAMRRERFVLEQHSFKSRGSSFDTEDSWDTGEAISRREHPAVHLIPVSRNIGPHWLGPVWEGVGYHNMYAVRHLKNLGREERDRQPIDGVITYGDSRAAWNAAVAEFLGLSAKQAIDLTDIPSPERRPSSA